jgi:uncharacterized membrane protein YbhN (UPF0104 family)
MANDTRLRDWLLGGGILVGLLVWVHFAIGWGRVLAPWRAVPRDELLLLFGLSCLSYLGRGARLYAYFPDLLRGRLWATLRLSVLHNVANNLLPMRAGEAAFPLLMKRYFGHGYAGSAFALLWIRLLDLHVIGLIALYAAWLASPQLLWWMLAGLWLLLLPGTFVFRGRLLAGLGEREGRWTELARRALNATPTSGARYAVVYLWTVASWAAKLAAFTAIVLQFIEIPRWQAFVGVIGAELSSVLPFHGIAGSGSYEVAMVAALLPFGIASADGLRAALNLHLFLLGVTLSLGALALLVPVKPLTHSSAA